MSFLTDENKKINRKDFLKYSSAATAALALPAASGCSSAELKNIPEINYNQETLFTNCNVIDVKKGKVVKNSSIRVRKGRIVSVEKGSNNTENATVVDLKNRFVMPGLIDAHCHTTVTPVFDFELTDIFKHLDQQKRHFTTSIESGVTTIRDVGAFPATLHGAIKDIKNKKLNGPRVVFCNSIMNINGGHPDIPPSDMNIMAKPVSLFIGMVPVNFENMEELEEALIDNAKNASLLKITVDNKSIFSGKKGDFAVYSDAHFEKMFSFADSKNLPVSAHCHRKWGLNRAIKYPLNSLEHIVSDAYLSDKEVETMAKKKISIVPTMTVGQAYLIEEAYDSLPKEYKDDFTLNEMKLRNEYLADVPLSHCDPVLHKKNMKAMKLYKEIGRENLWDKKKFLVNPDLYFGMIKYGSENLRKMRDAGVLIGCAIDAGMPFSYFGGFYREFELYSRIGFTNEEIIRSVTLNNAKIIGMEDSIGSIEKGKYADMVVFSENPLEKIEAMRIPEVVIREGELVHSRKQLRFDAACSSVEC